MLDRPALEWDMVREVPDVGEWNAAGTDAGPDASRGSGRGMLGWSWPICGVVRRLAFSWGTDVVSNVSPVPCIMEPLPPKANPAIGFTLDVPILVLSMPMSMAKSGLTEPRVPDGYWEFRSDVPKRFIEAGSAPIDPMFRLEKVSMVIESGERVPNPG
jgi:hypothetical protein